MNKYYLAERPIIYIISTQNYFNNDDIYLLNLYNTLILIFYFHEGHQFNAICWLELEEQ